VVVLFQPPSMPKSGAAESRLRLARDSGQGGVGGEGAQKKEPRTEAAARGTEHTVGGEEPMTADRTII
jgi:hypothetical protein